MKHVKLAATLAAFLMMAVLAAPAVSAEKSVDLTATVLEPKPEIGIELSANALDFGELYPGDTSDAKDLKVTNIGLKEIDVTATASDDGAEQLFVPGLLIDNMAYGEYSATLAAEEFDDTLLALHVPDDYSSRGAVSGGAIFWAEEHSESSPITDFTYTSDGSKVTITGYVGSGGNVIIPAKIDGLPVEIIGEESFYWCQSMTSVTIPDGLTTIGQSAFFGCTGLTSVIIPDSVTTIGASAFTTCSALTSVRIGNGITTIGNNVFSGTGLTAVTIPDNVKTIATNAFRNCVGLTSIVIPDSVTSIGTFAFYSAGLTSITVGKGVTSIGNGVFRDCTALTTIVFNGNAPSVGSNWVYIESLNGNNPNVVAYYQQGAIGFTTPTWNGVSCYPLGKTWTVDNDRVEYPAADFTTISEAIATASAGDTVKVYAGTYVGSITIDKALDVEGVGMPVIDDGRSGKMGVSITAQDVVFKGFKVTNTASLCFGIWINANGVTVERCIIDGCNEGIWIDSCSGVTVKQNTISNCWGWVGLYINSEGNSAYLNDFLGNPSGDIYEMGGPTTFNTPTQVSYTYEGSAFTGYLGNYYGSFSRTDADGNGVAGSANSSDIYPLMQPWEDYGL
jgi:parallel beta-helix repeat protein